MDAIGPEPSDTLLGYLPPVGWADVATKQDLAAFGADLRGEIRHLEGRIDGLEGRIDGLDHKIDSLADRLEGRLHRELHKQDLWLLGMTITIVMALFAAPFLG